MVTGVEQPGLSRVQAVPGSAPVFFLLPGRQRYA
jgi:hypothetical protein